MFNYTSKSQSGRFISYTLDRKYAAQQLREAKCAHIEVALRGTQRPLASLAKLESLWHQYGWPGEERCSGRPGVHIVNTKKDEDYGYGATLWVVSFGDFAPEHMAVWARHAEDAVNLVVNYAHDQGWKGLVSQDPADWLDEEGLAELQDENGNGFPEGLGYEDPGLYYDSYTLHFCEVR